MVAGGDSNPRGQDYDSRAGAIGLALASLSVRMCWLSSHSRRCCPSSLAGVHDRRPLDLAEMEHIERRLEIARALELKNVGMLLCRLVPASDRRERRPESANPTG